MKIVTAKNFKPRKRKNLSIFSDDDLSEKSVSKTSVTKETKEEVVASPPLDIKDVSPPLVTRSDEYSLLPPPDPDDEDESSDIYSLLSSYDELDDGEGLPDPVAMIDRAISADLDPSIFTERAFEIAPNIIEWCRNPEFLGYTGELFPKQLQVLAHFFSDVCYFCSDTDYIHDVPVDASIGDVLDRFTLLQYGVCPKCKRNRLELLTDWQRDPRFWDHNEYDNNVNVRPVPPNEFVGVWGQRSGKSYSVATFAAPYIFHRYLSLPSPTRYFNQPNNVVFEAAFVAPTLHQITKYMWTPFREVYDSSPWFREFRRYLNSEGKRTGVQLYHSGSTFLAFPSKRLAIHILAASSSGLRGGTRLFCLDGDTLVNTTRGLLPIKEDLSDTDIWIRNKAQRITTQCMTGTKLVQETVLKDGYSVVTTLDHRIKTLSPDLLEVWKEAKDLALGDYVAVSVGAEFPKELRLHYTPTKRVHRQLAAHQLMAKLKTFTSAQLFEETGLKGIYALTHSLIKRGMLKKRYITGQGRNAGCTYHITTKFDINKLEEEYRNHTLRNRDTCTFPSKMTPAIGYLLGYYVSEGSYAKGATEFSFTNTDETVIKHFVSCFEEVFGFTPRTSSCVPKKGSKTCFHIVVSYKVVKKFLRYLGMAPSVAVTKTVPWSILQAPRDVVLAFLSAFIEGDGYIDGKYIFMSSVSQKLIQQLQLLLLNVGVTSTVQVQKRPKKHHRDLLTLRLRRYDSIKLMRQLSCPTKGRVFDYEINKRFHTVYRLPFVPSFIDNSLHGGSIAKHIYTTSVLNHDSYDSYALKRLQKQDAELYKKATKLVDTSIVWLPVVEKNQLEERPVFDISIDSDAHEFSANGIVVHNCAQDELGWFNCLTGDTLVSTTDGLIPIEEDLRGREAWLNGKTYEILRHVSTGHAEIQETSLERGYTLKSTVDHRVCVLTPDLDIRWKEAGALELGDHVAVGIGGEFPQKLELSYLPERKVLRELEAQRLMADLKTFYKDEVAAPFELKGLHVLLGKLVRQGKLVRSRDGRHCVYSTTDKFDIDKIEANYKDPYPDRINCNFPEEMTPELGYLLGYYVSEGSYAKGSVKFAFTNTDTRLVDHFIECFTLVFGITPKLITVVPNKEKYPTHRTAYHVYTAYAVIKKFLRYVGMKPSIAHTKGVPWSILRAPKESVLAFLSAYIDGDGSISNKNVSMSTTSKKLATQLQLLCLRLGLVSSIIKSHKQKNHHNDAYTVHLPRYDSIRLVAQLSCRTKGYDFDSIHRTRREDSYKLPFVPSFEDTSRTYTSSSAPKYVYVLNALNQNSDESYALKCLQQEDPELYSKVERLVASGVLWLPVVKKENVGVQPVFDIAIDSPSHAFIANGMVVHNCDDSGRKRAGTKDGTEVFNALSNSLTTIRTQADYRRETLGDYNSLDAYMFNISSPSSISDPIMQRAAIATRAPRMFYTHFKTWEVNPKEKEYVIREQKAGDMESFLRDFCAIPPRALSPFLPEHRLVQDLIHAEGEEVLFKYGIERQEDDDGFRWVRPVLGEVAYDPFNARVLAIDNGENNNSFALCVARYLPDIDGVLFEEFVEVAPTHGSTVDLAWCYDKFIVPLVTAFNFLHVGFDRWNSAYAVHDLRTNPSLKVDAQRYSLKWKDFVQFRDELRGMKVWLPTPELAPDDLLQMRDFSRRAESPRAHFQLQLTTVNQFGKRLYKPDNGNDDLFRVGALAHSFIQRYKKEYQKQSAFVNKRKNGSSGSVGIFRGASRRGGGSTMGGGLMGGQRSTSERSVGNYRSGRR